MSFPTISPSRITPRSIPSQAAGSIASTPTEAEQPVTRAVGVDSVHFGAGQHNALTLAVKGRRLDQLRGHTPAEINARDEKGWTPLTLAAYTGQHQAIELLCQQLGAEINLPETHGHTPLMVAVFNEKP